MEIKIAISTRGRSATLDYSVSQWNRYYPEAEIIIVEDNDEIPRGIARTKNLCLEALRKSNCKHGFIVDDDVYPIDNVGLYSYLKIGSHHACMSFDHLVNGKRISNEVFIDEVSDDWVSYNSPCGCLLYVSRTVLDSGISYDENYGIWGLEHKDFSLKIHKQGLTSMPFLDIPNSVNHFYSYDYHMTIKSSVPEHIRIQEIKRNTEYFNKKNYESSNHNKE